MASVLIICICISVVIYQLYKYMFSRPANFPPGPPRIPVFGSYLYLLLLNYKHFHFAVKTLCKYYKTTILGLYLGETPTIAIYETEGVKEALFHKDFDGRAKILLAKLRDPEFELRGIFFVDGPFWKNQRRFALRHLRDYGFGRRFEELEIEIGEEINNLIDLIKNGPKYDFEKKFFNGTKILVPSIFSACTSNVFLKVLTNERSSRKDFDALYKVSDEVYKFQRYGDLWGRLFSLTLFEPIAYLFPQWSEYKTLRECSMNLHNFMKNIVEEHVRTYDPNHDRSILDLYIKEVKEAEANKQPSFFYYKNLIMICVDFFFPASSAIPGTIQFLLQQLSVRPEIQAKIQKEIDDVVGHGRLPTLDDRINLPYTEASIREIMRFETLVPSGLGHLAITDTSFRGYDVPEGTVIFPMLTGSHHDTSKWYDPSEFKPERFLDVNGKLSLKSDISLPFGAGKRLCAGETFARNMLFLLVSALMQNFSVKDDDVMKYKSKTGLITYLPDFYIQLESR